MLQLSVRGCAVVCRVGRGGVLHARMHVPRADFVRGVVQPGGRHPAGSAQLGEGYMYST